MSITLPSGAQAVQLDAIARMIAAAPTFAQMAGVATPRERVILHEEEDPTRPCAIVLIEEDIRTEAIAGGTRTFYAPWAMVHSVEFQCDVPESELDAHRNLLDAEETMAKWCGLVSRIIAEVLAQSGRPGNVTIVNARELDHANWMLPEESGSAPWLYARHALETGI